MDEAIEKLYAELMEPVKGYIVQYITFDKESDALFEEYNKTKKTSGDRKIQQRAEHASQKSNHFLACAQSAIESLQPFAMLKQSELQTEQKNILDRMEKASHKQGQLAIGISIVSLVFAGLAAIFSWNALSVSNEALRSSTEWQQEQIPILKEIRDRPPVVVEKAKKPATPKEAKGDIDGLPSLP